MRNSHFTEEQIIGMIKEQEAGMPMAKVYRTGLHRSRQAAAERLHRVIQWLPARRMTE